MSFRREVALGPAFDLSAVISVGMSQFVEAGGLVVERMKVGEVLDEAAADLFAGLLRVVEVFWRYLATPTFFVES